MQSDYFEKPDPSSPKKEDKQPKWRANIVAWSKMDEYLNSEEDNGYEVINIIEQKSFEEGQIDDYCLVVSKNVSPSSSRKRFY